MCVHWTLGKKVELEFSAVHPLRCVSFELSLRRCISRVLIMSTHYKKTVLSRVLLLCIVCIQFNIPWNRTMAWFCILSSMREHTCTLRHKAPIVMLIEIKSLPRFIIGSRNIFADDTRSLYLTTRKHVINYDIIALKIKWIARPFDAELIMKHVFPMNVIESFELAFNRKTGNDFQRKRDRMSFSINWCGFAFQTEIRLMLREVTQRTNHSKRVTKSQH